MAGNVQKKLTMGIHPLSYLGVNAESPPNSILLMNQDPTSSDWQNFIVGDIWINENGNPTPASPRIWMLGSISHRIATWILIASGAGDVSTLTGNTTLGGPPMPVPPLLGNINVVGDGTTINVDGNPATHTLTISAIGTGLVQRFVTDNGTATPIAGVIDIFAQPQAGSSVTFSAATNVIRLNTSDALGNTIIGNSAGNPGISGGTNTAVGTTSLNALTSGTTNTAIGWASQLFVDSGSANTSCGTGCLTSLTSGGSNTALGNGVFARVGGNITTGSFNIGIGSDAGSNYATGTESSNILINNNGVNGESNIIKIGTFGSGAGQQNATFLFGGTVNVPNGNLALPTTNATVGQVTVNAIRFLHGFGTGNTFVGSGSGNFTLTGTNSVAVGNGTLAALMGGLHNVAIGSLAGASVTNSNDNILIGSAAGFSITGAANVIIGTSGAGVLTTGGSNVGLGTSVFNGGGGAGLITGSNNVAIGASAGSAYTGAESGNILVNHTGVVGESNNTRIGVQGTQNKCFIAGIRGVTTDNADAIAVLISSVGQLGTVSSSQRYKENIQDMNDQSNIIYDLKPKTFNFKKHPDSPAWGLIAEDVDQVFPQLVVYDNEGKPESVRYHELVPLLLNEIQKLNKRIEALEN